MNKWSLAIGQDGLLRYGDRFSADLQQYVRRILESYVRSRKDKMVSEVLRLWSKISEVHGRREFHDSQNVSQIHGDFGPSNILINKEYPHKIKLIDWEWAGLGMAHADLASLLKGVSHEIERYALVIFSRQDKTLSLGEHHRLYNWCQLERGLLDGGFVAAQYMNSPTTTRLNLPGFVEHSMQRVMRAYQKLI